MMSSVDVLPVGAEERHDSPKRMVRSTPRTASTDPKDFAFSKVDSDGIGVTFRGPRSGPEPHAVIARPVVDRQNLHTIPPTRGSDRPCHASGRRSLAPTRRLSQGTSRQRAAIVGRRPEQPCPRGTLATPNPTGLAHPGRHPRPGHESDEFRSEAPGSAVELSSVSGRRGCGHDVEETCTHHGRREGERRILISTTSDRIPLEEHHMKLIGRSSPLGGPLEDESAGRKAARGRGEDADPDRITGTWLKLWPGTA